MTSPPPTGPRHNDANVICLGGGPGLAEAIDAVDTFFPPVRGRPSPAPIDEITAFDVGPPIDEAQPIERPA